MARVQLKRQIVNVLSSYGVDDIFFASQVLPTGRKVRIANLTPAEGKEIDFDSITKAGGLLGIVSGAVGMVGNLSRAYLDKVTVPDVGEMTGAIFEIGDMIGAPETTTPKATATAPTPTRKRGRPRKTPAVTAAEYNPQDASQVLPASQRPLHRSGVRGRKPKWQIEAEAAADAAEREKQEQQAAKPAARKRGRPRKKAA